MTKFDIPYDELLFGKPYAHVYVDDSAIHALIDTAKEIGWSLNNEKSDYLTQKTIKGFISSRQYHTIQELGNLIIKSSSTNSLQGEIYFYQNIPPSILDLFPRLDRIENNEDVNISSIVMEKIKGIAYSYIFSNSCLTEGRLLKLLKALVRIHSSLPLQSTEPTVNIYANYSTKVRDRYNQYNDIYRSLDNYFLDHPETSLINSVKFVDHIVDYFNDYEKSRRGQYFPIIHGDPVFSNILLTPDNRIIFLDMRGILGTELSLQGDRNYDLAKVYQSLTGYDFILLDKAHLLCTPTIETYLSEMVEIFIRFISSEYHDTVNMNDITMITVQLYFSLIPLHTKLEHQVQFYKLATKLYQNTLRCTRDYK